MTSQHCRCGHSRDAHGHYATRRRFCAFCRCPRFRRWWLALPRTYTTRPLVPRETRPR